MYKVKGKDNHGARIHFDNPFVLSHVKSHSDMFTETVKGVFTLATVPPVEVMPPPPNPTSSSMDTNLLDDTDTQPGSRTFTHNAAIVADQVQASSRDSKDSRVYYMLTTRIDL